jgi:hypothetical protein
MKTLKLTVAALVSIAFLSCENNEVPPAKESPSTVYRVSVDGSEVLPSAVITDAEESAALSVEPNQSNDGVPAQHAEDSPEAASNGQNSPSGQVNGYNRPTEPEVVISE